MSRTETAPVAPVDPDAVVRSGPPRFWQDVERLFILCLVKTPRGIDAGMLHTGICDVARTLSTRSAPLPVTVVKLGDPAILQPGSVTLLVHISISDARDGALAALSVRPYRNDADHGGLLFGAAPRAVRLSSDNDFAALKPALAAALAETLPWQNDRPTRTSY